MNKNIWIMNHYAIGHLADRGGRHYWLSENLRKDGYEPVVFGCNVKHNSIGSYFGDDKLWQEQYSESGVKYVPIYSTQYVGNGFSRIKNMFIFAWNLYRVGKEYAKKYGKPDVIYASSVHPLTIITGEFLARQFGVPCIGEVRDLWPETLVDYGAIKRNSLFTKLLYWGEKWIYKHADAMIFTMEGAPDYIRERGWDKEHGGPIDLNRVFHICNGVDLEQFDYNAENYVLPDPDLDNQELFCAVYTGAIKRANNVGLLIEAAEYLKNIDNLRILIWGAGNEVEELKKLVHDKGLDGRVVLKGFVGKKYIPGILRRSDVLVMKGEHWSVIDYGYSLNKLFEYLASGSIVLSNIGSKRSLLINRKCGIETPGPEPKCLADELRRIYNFTLEEQLRWRKRAREVVADYDFKVLTKKLENIIESL